MATKPRVERGDGAGADGGVAAELAALIEAMAKGEESALAAFYDRTRHQAYGLIWRILKDAALAEEVTLDVYLQVWRKAAEYRAERGSPLGWLVILARSRAIDRARGLKAASHVVAVEPSAQEFDAAAPDPMPDEWLVDAERARHVRGALDRLTPEQRQAIRLAYYEGLSHGEIARRLTLPLGTVKTRIRAGMARLQELLAPLASETLP